MKVLAVTVTYGDRFHLLDQVIDSLIREGVDEIWVVDNNSSPESQTQLVTKALNNELVKIIAFPDNVGSAGAYYKIFERASQLKGDQFIWLLDDDNVVLPQALSSLINTFELLQKDFGDPVLYSYRGHSGKEDIDAVTSGMIKGPRPNTYCGFEVADLFRKDASQSPESLESADIKYPLISVKWGPYGGMFSNLATFKKIGLPKRELVVYADDQEFSYRFHRLGIQQFVVYSSQIQDIDQSVGEGGGYFGANTSLLKIFYGLRNTTYLSKNMSDNSVIYFFNKWTFIFVMCLLAAKNYFKSPQIVKERLPWIWKALRDGERGNLGLDPLL